MKLYYRIRDNEIEIIRSFGNDTRVVLPGYIHGIPVTKVAPYAFSMHKEEEPASYLSYTTKGHLLSEQEICVLAGDAVEEIVLPDTVGKIGNYIFYGCRKLKKLTFSDTLFNIGSGAFTGCSALAELHVHMNSGRKSCVKEILGELWQRIDVDFCYEKQEKRAELVFPQHYEEAVENTPARILYTQHHGSGNDYRQCFFDYEMDYRKYDRLFFLAAARDSADVFVDIAFKRLMFPYELKSKYEIQYKNIIINSYKETLKYLIVEERIKYLKYLSVNSMWNREMIDYALDLASYFGKAEIAAYLMDVKHLNFKRNKKVFEL